LIKLISDGEIKINLNLKNFLLIIDQNMASKDLGDKNI
jgi:hypothetical protein